MTMPNILPLTSDEYWGWNKKLEAGYGQARSGISAEQVAGELRSIPRAMQYSYIFKKYIGNEGGRT